MEDSASASDAVPRPRKQHCTHYRKLNIPQYLQRLFSLLARNYLTSPVAVDIQQITANNQQSTFKTFPQINYPSCPVSIWLNQEPMKGKMSIPQPNLGCFGMPSTGIAV
ncbi:hypothetical protein [Nostoc sp. CMAA1605]|uniref:hypothetical protein n=1 Tax=Nostoc sp. CMAA1605 TaxID=2055159 RepID=UPI001F2E0FD0|nr:hypothetical protein [Nostoc sp. CMAA1605]